jgi:multiple sugar transport system permease protein
MKERAGVAMWRTLTSHTAKGVIYAILGTGAFIMLMPFVWMLVTSLKPLNEVTVFPPKWVFWPLQWQNYVEAWNTAPFGRYFFNSITVSVVTTVLEVIVCAMAAYAFARMEFFGKNLLFMLMLGSIMIPGEVLLVPNFITLVRLSWIDTYWALIVPWIVSVFGIFFMRQAFLQLPQELFDAGKIDGCGHFRFLWRVVMPLSKPVVTTVALFKFIGSWNAFLWVLIVTNSPKMRTIPVGLSYFSTEVGTDYNLLMAASTFSLLPVLILFFLAQKQFIQGIARTGLK